MAKKDSNLTWEQRWHWGYLKGVKPVREETHEEQVKRLWAEIGELAIAEYGEFNAEVLKKMLDATQEKPSFKTMKEYQQMYDSSDGPLNAIHDLEKQLKGQVIANECIKQLQPKSLKEYRKNMERADKILTNDGYGVFSWIKKNGKGGLSLKDLAHYLFKAQFTTTGRKVLAYFDSEDPRPFDKATCEYWIDKLYVENTYCGWRAEIEAREAIVEKLRNGIMRADGSIVNVEVKIPDANTDAKGLDIIVMEKGTDNVMFGVQVKPESFHIKSSHQDNYDDWRYGNTKMTIGFYGETRKITKKQRFETYLCIYGLSEDRNHLEWQNLDSQLTRMWTGDVCPHLAS